MEITWLGSACFRLKGRDTTILMDPPSAASGQAIARQVADIVTISREGHDGEGADAFGEAARVIRGPGEYEVSGVLIDGVRTYQDGKQGAESGRNTVFVVEVEDLRICHLGSLNQIPTAEQTEELSGVDILLAPVGGHGTLDAPSAAEVVSLLEPKLVIPMSFRNDLSSSTLDPLDPFLKQMGMTEVSPQPRLSITHSGLPAETQVVVLEPRK